MKIVDKPKRHIHESASVPVAADDLTPNPWSSWEPSPSPEFVEEVEPDEVGPLESEKVEPKPVKPKKPKKPKKDPLLAELRAIRKLLFFQIKNGPRLPADSAERQEFDELVAEVKQDTK